MSKKKQSYIHKKFTPEQPAEENELDELVPKDTRDAHAPLTTQLVVSEAVISQWSSRCFWAEHARLSEAECWPGGIPTR